MSYRALKRQFQLDDASLEDLKVELIEAQRWPSMRTATSWSGRARRRTHRTPGSDQAQAPLAYTPPHLAEKILTSRSALEGERKQVTVLFADLKGSMELLADRDPEEARQLLDPVLERMMDAVHRYEGTVNQVLGDGIMALFGAPLAHEDHAVRACYAALAMQEAVQPLRRGGAPHARACAVQIRVGLNSGEVVVRAIGNDLHMDYSAVGQTTHLAARMEQLATPGTILLTAGDAAAGRGLRAGHAAGAGAGQGAGRAGGGLRAGRGQRRAAPLAGRRGAGADAASSGATPSWSSCARPWSGPARAMARSWPWSGEPGVGKSRLVYEFIHSHRTAGLAGAGERLGVLRQGHAATSRSSTCSSATVQVEDARRRRAPSAPR